MDVLPPSVEDWLTILTDADWRSVRDEALLRPLFRYFRRRAYDRQLGPIAADRAFYRQTGRVPDGAWYCGSTLGDRPTDADRVAYQTYVLDAARRSAKPFTWAVEQFQQEFGRDAPWPAQDNP